MTDDEARRLVGRHMTLLELLWPYHDGPAHVVVGDDNLTDTDIQLCLAYIERGEPCSESFTDTSDPVYAATEAVLRSLLAVPAEVRDVWEGWYEPA